MLLADSLTRRGAHYHEQGSDGVRHAQGRRQDANPGSPAQPTQPSTARCCVLRAPPLKTPPRAPTRAGGPGHVVFTDEQAELRDTWDLLEVMWSLHARAGSPAWFSGPQACVLATHKAPPFSACWRLELSAGPGPTAPFPHGPSCPPPPEGTVSSALALPGCTLGIAPPTGVALPALVTNPAHSDLTWAFCLLAATRRKWYRGATGRLMSSRPAEGSRRADRVFSGLPWSRASLMRLTARTSGKERSRWAEGPD